MSLNRRIANLGNVIDSATTGHFLSKGDSDGQFSTVAYSSIVGTPTVLDSALTSQLVDSSYIQLRQTTSAAGLDSALITTLVDSSYVAARAGSGGGGGSGFVKYQYTATQGQTTFQDSASSGATLSYSENYILVHYNGVALPSSDYTATNGNSVVLGTGADSGAIVSIAKWSAASSGGGGASFYGDRGLNIGGTPSSGSVSPISYVDITTLGNAQDFGDMVADNKSHAAVSSGSIAVAGGGRHITGNSSAFVDDMGYFAIASTGNATDFGDLTLARSKIAAAGDTTRGIWGGGYNMASDVMDYVTIATPGNATDFGNLATGVGYLSSSADLTYSLFALGEPANGVDTNQIQYVTTQTAGNASDFGDCTVARYSGSCGVIGSSTRGLFCGGYADALSATQNLIEYVTIATPGNATDFGDMTQAKYDMATTSNGTRGLIMGGDAGDEIDYVTIDTPGNAADFGDLITSLTNNEDAGASGNAA